MKEALYELLAQKGFPKEFCDTLITKYLNTEYTQMRMFGYLSRFSEPSMEMVVDEMLAILSDRESFIQKKQMEETQAKLNVIYREGLGVEDDE